MQAALHGILGHPRKIVTAHQVAHDEHLRVPGHGEVGLHRDPSRAVRRRPQFLRGPPREGHRLDTGGPQHGPCGVLSGKGRRTSARSSRRRDARRSRAPPCATRRRGSSKVLAALPAMPGAKLLSTRSPPSNSNTRASSGAMLWNSWARVRVAISRICPASSTPVGPPPATTNVNQPSRSGPGGSVSAISNAPNRRRRMASASSRVFIPGAHCANSGMPEVGLLHPDGDDQHVVVEGERTAVRSDVR